MKKSTIHKKLSIREILKRHKSNPMDKDLHKIIEEDGDSSLGEKSNSLLEKVSKPLKS